MKELFSRMHGITADNQLSLNQTLDRRPSLINSVFKRTPYGRTENVDPIKNRLAIWPHPNLGEEAL